MSTPIKLLFENQLAKSLELRSESIKERKERLFQLKTWILTHKDRIRKALHHDLKRSIDDIDLTEIFPVTGEINKALHHLNEWSRAKRVSAGLTYLGTVSHIQYEPKGRCLIIAPWNYPFQLMCCPLVSCIAAGNTAILKPSENTPATSLLIREMIEELYDANTVTVVEGAVEETQELLSLPFDHIFFTGSTTVGKIVMESAAKHLTSVTLELGGKSPVIIDESADAEDAAKKITWGRFSNNGQTCIAPDYIFVHESKLDTFVASSKKHIQHMFDPESVGLEHSSSYSRIVNSRQTNRLLEILDDALDKGAKTLIGGDHKASKLFIEPTLLSDIDDSARIWNEEIFGPIMPLRAYTNLAPIIDHINTQAKPLSLYLFSQNKQTQQTIANRTSSGSLVINDVVIQYTHPNLPFGGVNHSGIGKSHGHFGFLEFSNQKPVLKQRVGWTTAMLFYPPLSPIKRWLLAWMTKII
ncbi:aldehyde dehydrogenase [Reichenbachiella sp. 5M10]|uniref:aldehyde dehydrogenase family protein n=1 Tax=Reichenbachiella sp. 5M10 TaxID=1889772 RepID=UPI000C154F8A|nr:aldehyde dehydrogenase family protein [Reichenbachiella sp. 5M10]PIB36053.1 aldehyde dehydrogenase [Reichenbachiella sp. 5M10]